MKGTIKLDNPIAVAIDGKQVQLAELKYDTNEITGALFCEADSKRRFAAGAKNVSIAPAAEFDCGLHLYLGFAAIIAADSNIDFADLERIHGADLIDVMEVGRNFIMKSEDSAQSNSDDHSETTAEPTTQA
ncbi:MAG: hypothetical protein J6Q53_04445 [Oscillospiraceae bacterium]|nr:hypothetical protein [Oscillospiraceae bacterium]